jgi:hypothetical protein
MERMSCCIIQWGCYVCNEKIHGEKAMSDKIDTEKLRKDMRDDSLGAYFGGACEKAILDETPNAETLEAMTELENGGGHKFSGTTEKLFTGLMED